MSSPGGLRMGDVIENDSIVRGVKPSSKFKTMQSGINFAFEWVVLLMKREDFCK